MAIKRKSVFTASMAGQEIQRRFLLGQRLFFTFGVMLAWRPCGRCFFCSKNPW